MASAASLDSLPIEVLELVLSYVDAATLRACLLTRALFEAAVDALWHTVALPPQLSPAAWAVVRVLRKGTLGAQSSQSQPDSQNSGRANPPAKGAAKAARKPATVFPYAQWVRSLAVHTAAAELSPKMLKDIAGNLTGGRLRRLVLTMRERAVQDMWASVVDALPDFADQIRELHLLGVDAVGPRLVTMVSQFEHLEALGLEVRGSTAPDRVSNLIRGVLSGNRSLLSFEYSDSAPWLWYDPIRLEGSLGTISKHGGHIASLKLRGIRYCDGALLRALAEGLGRLQELALRDFWLAEDASFADFFKALPKLTRLRMENTTSIPSDALEPQTELQHLSLCLDLPPLLLEKVASFLENVVELDVRSATAHADVDLDALAPIADRLQLLYLDTVQLASITPRATFPALTRFGLGPAVRLAQGDTLGAAAARDLFAGRFPRLHTAGLAAFYGALGDRVDHRWLSETFLAAHPGVRRVFLGVASASFVAADRLPELRRRHRDVSFERCDWFEGGRAL